MDRRGTRGYAGRAARPARRRGGAGSGWLKRQLARRPLPIWAVLTADVLVFAVALLTFALFHHVLPRNEQSVGVVSRRVASQTATTVQAQPGDTSAEGSVMDGATPDNTAADNTAIDNTMIDNTTVDNTTVDNTAIDSTPADSAAIDAAAPDTAPAQTAPDPVGVFANRFADKFTDGEPVTDETGYIGKNVNIRYSRHAEPGLVYYVADIHVRHIECLRSAFAKDKFGRGRWERVASLCTRHNGVIAINGDYYGGRADGIVIRNGELYRDDTNLKRDVCVIYWDGSMEIFTPQTWNTDQAMANGAYQAWNFGPSLLDEQGNAKETFNSEVTGKNPRSAIGYYEPGHYCFVVVDGRSSASKGITLADFSELMHGLGCTMAYNMDGGQSAEMVVQGQIVSKPYKGGRKTSDAILIVDE